MSVLVPRERIEQTILGIHAHRVMLNTDLAKRYRVSTTVLNQAVTRNITRVQDDCMFQLTGEEATAVRSQIVTVKAGRGPHRKETGEKRRLDQRSQ
jgi:hypothetical protein